MNTAKYYTSITELPLSKFIEVLIDDNVYALAILGEPTAEELRNAWTDLMMEYNYSMQDNEDKLYYRLLKEVRVLEITMKEIELCVVILRMGYDKETADDLNKLTDSKFKFDINTDSYQSEIERAFKRGKSIEMRYHLKKADLENIQPKQKKTEKPTKEYFIKILITLTDHAGIRLSAEDITVFEFCERVKRFAEYQEAEKKKNKT